MITYMHIIREFKDVLFEDVVFDHNMVVAIYYDTMYYTCW